MALRFNPAGDVRPTTSLRLTERTLAEVARRAETSETTVGTATFRTAFTYENTTDRISHLDLTFSLLIEMPVWQGYGTRPKAEKDEWDRFYRALLQHERGHIEIYKNGARQMYTRMAGATTATIQSVHDEEMARIKRLNAEYDRTTDHGRRQQTPYGTTVITVPRNPR
jgi:predicted secreted Zn-dependent protease